VRAIVQEKSKGLASLSDVSMDMGLFLNFSIH
jgi:hypothetical protein